VASISYPSPTYNGGSVTDLEFERLTGQQAPDGLIGTPTDLPLVYADGTGTRRVMVRANRRGLIRGFAFDSGATDIPLTLAANTSGSTRIDLIVLRLDRSTWKVTEAVVQGMPGAGAPSVTLNTGAVGVWEMPVASVTVVNGASTLAAGTVTPLAWYLGDDGQILCTPTTRPPHALGRAIYEPAGGARYTSNGSAWSLVGQWRATQILSATQPDVVFTNIPSGLRVVEVHWTARSTDPGFAAQELWIRINGSTANFYRSQYVQGANTAAAATGGVNQSASRIGLLASASGVPGLYGNGAVRFHAWNAPHTGDLGFTFSNALNSTTNSWYRGGSGLFVGDGPYTSLTFLPELGSFVAGTQFTVIGTE
jgi:hypothetical protein